MGDVEHFFFFGGVAEIFFILMHAHWWRGMCSLDIVAKCGPKGPKNEPCGGEAPAGEYYDIHHSQEWVAGSVYIEVRPVQQGFQKKRRNVEL